MKLLTWIAGMFINTFGITRPKPEQERATNLVIGGALLTFGVAVLALMSFLIFQIMAGSHGR